MIPEECLSTSKDDPDSSTQLIPCVNFHLWQPCNFRCKFCYATFVDVKSTVLPKGHLSKRDSEQVVLKLAEAGFRKITFAGGEPTLCPWLPDLVVIAKKAGLTTGIITNGFKLTAEYIQTFSGHLDWIGISIDSLDPETNSISGRKQPGQLAPNRNFYLQLCKNVINAGCKLKINTVVHANNKNEIISDFIHEVNPIRWKIMRVLQIKGQNDPYFDSCSISDQEFLNFILRNSDALIQDPIVEDHQNIIGSYMMVDPAGRFFDDTKGTHTYSEPILEVGVENALKQTKCYYQKFIDRKGLYNWE